MFLRTVFAFFDLKYLKAFSIFYTEAKDNTKQIHIHDTRHVQSLAQGPIMALGHIFLWPFALILINKVLFIPQTELIHVISLFTSCFSTMRTHWVLCTHTIHSHECWWMISFQFQKYMKVIPKVGLALAQTQTSVLFSHASVIAADALSYY